MKVKLSDIIGAIEMTDQDSDYFLDKETGEILWSNSEVMENEELEEIDTSGAKTLLRMNIEAKRKTLRARHF